MMSAFYLSQNPAGPGGNIDFYMKHKGREHQLSGAFHGFSYIYDIAGHAFHGKQNFMDADYLVLMDGCLYPDRKDQTESCLIGLYERYQEEFLRHVEGEFALCFFDAKKSRVIFSTDVFGTRPLWYSGGGDFCAGTNKSALERSGCREIRRAKPNTTYVYDLKKNEIQTGLIHRFQLEQYQDNYEEWISAFSRAVQKRGGDVSSGMGLSSGYDSGAIFCETVRHTYDCKAYAFPGRENRDILKQRLILSEEAEEIPYNESEYLSAMKKLYRYCEPYRNEYFDLLKDEASMGVAIICQHMKREKRNIYLSGYGADEIISDYGFSGKKLVEPLSQFGGLFPERLEEIFPWKNFFEGTQEIYLTRESHICGLFEIEPRYPFLDIQVVQSFLSLKQELKNRFYKAPIHAYFKKYQFPFAEEKMGFFLKGAKQRGEI